MCSMCGCIAWPRCQLIATQVYTFKLHIRNKLRMIDMRAVHILQRSACSFLPRAAIACAPPSQWSSPLCMPAFARRDHAAFVTRRPHVAWQAQARLQAAIVSLHFLQMPTPSASALRFQPALQCMALAGARCMHIPNATCLTCENMIVCACAIVCARTHCMHVHAGCHDVFRRPPFTTRWRQRA
jgi:hypothetical protein